jgi:pSer/pThr/pTyr-binding forkhead associated (FHA) protein
MKIKMRVIRGKPRGHAIQFPAGEFVFGRGPECHVRPNSELVSRQHCILTVSDTGVQVRDLGSSNGTLVNGTRVIEEVSLRDGDVLQLGPLVLQLVLEDDRIVQDPTVVDTHIVDANETLLDPPSGASRH